MTAKLTALMALSLTLLAGIAFGQEAAEAVAEESAVRESILSLLQKGGIVMIPLAACSILALTMTIERFISLKRERVIPEDLEDELKQKLGPVDNPDIEGAQLACDESDSPFGRAARYAIDRWKNDYESVVKSLEEAGGRELRRIRRSLRGLRVIATVSPLLGLMGTVFGMIGAFQTVANDPNTMGRSESLAQGIYEALVTTATGLTVAIPVLIIYFFLLNRAERLSDEIETSGSELLELHPGSNSAPALLTTEIAE